MQKNNVKREKAFLIGVVLKGSSSAQILEQLEEMEFLADTAGADIVSKTTQSRNMPDPATFIGKGKTQTIINQAKELECELIIFNDDISPTQLKNLQKEAGENIKVIDRTGLILDIFTKHAKTKEAKTQVQLAQLEYFLPRLTRQWTHLERQMGGIGTRAGAGETQIEIDRRLIRNQISKLKRELTAIEKQRKVQNHSREEAFRIALVGYTNAGKSTLMNALTDADVLVQNQLFATLDTTTRKLENIDVCIPVLLSDTVGFIRNLPHNLIASFRSTLGEIRDVDLLLKVFDASSNHIHEHIETVETVLKEMDMPNKTSIMVLNKIDAISDPQKLSGLKTRFKDASFISSLKNIDLNVLSDRIEQTITSGYQKDEFYLSFNQTKLLDTIYTLTRVLNKKSDYNGIRLEVEGNKRSLEKIRQIIGKE
ncbi:MAG TPA: GTPase HflX [Candidatus Marinimicrobia bacterium]|jgi:GTP-binding protein HflX|nr:GTPase HflX [Candidatus Neomarinimicrobiota bacterium]MDP7464751.1 GTPase HflX [Candidatus Neomarinimicrobiota bacterium]HJM84277.1 GTPase HflX [Candidatus Neomarinimicrobiota bacterium]